MLVIVFAGRCTVICSVFVFRSVYLMLVLVLAGLLFCVCFQTALHNAGHTFCWTVVCSVCFQTGMCNAGYGFCWTVINYSVFVFRWVCVMLVIVFAGSWTVICPVSVFRWVCIMVYSFYWTVVCSVFVFRRVCWTVDCSVFVFRQVCWTVDCSVFVFRRVCWTVDCSVFVFRRVCVMLASSVLRSCSQRWTN